MKKLFLASACAIMLAAATSCGGNASKESDNSGETAAAQPAAPAMTLAERNAQAGAAFIDSLKQNDSDVYFTETGLGYKVINEGNGPKPVATDNVRVKYTGMHTDGSVFDTSGDQEVPFPLSGVIPGFSQGLMLMPVGSTYRLYIPANLGYGERGAGGAIGPNETLIFDLELVGINN